jgi:hypothetical protein
VLDSASTSLLGVQALDLAVLSVLRDDGLVPPAPHRRSADVIRQLVDRGVCGAEDAYGVLGRLAAPWLMPLPLVDPHGNLGAMYDPPAQPMFTEVRLTPAGAMAVEAHRGEGPLLPIGLINGDLPLILGLDFGLWPEEGRRSTPEPLRLRPGFDPAGLVAAMNEVAGAGRTTTGDLESLVGAPWLEAFEPPTESFAQLIETGQQAIRLTPVTSAHEDWAYPPADVTLDLGAPLRDVLWEWLVDAADRTPDPPTLERLVASGTEMAG